MATKRRSSDGFTLIELLVVIAVIAVLLAILLPSLKRVREAGRRAVCMAHLHQMQIAWQTYADEHDGCIVNGQAWYEATSRNYGREWLIGGVSGPKWPNPSTQADADAMMRTGALAHYVGDVHVYLCPSRYRKVFEPPRPGWQWLSSYNIVASMNVFRPEDWSDWDRQIRASHTIGRTVLYVRKTSELADPGPSSRMVFLDKGYGWGYGTDLGGWGAWGSEWGWGWWGGVWGAPIHHSNGTCMSFADGHSEYWKWKDPRTVAYAQTWLDFWDRRAAGSSFIGIGVPTDWADNQDCVRLHKAVWGKGPE